MRELTKMEIEFINKVELIIEPYGHIIVKYDPDVGIINIDGPADTGLGCKIALTDFSKKKPDMKGKKQKMKYYTIILIGMAIFFIPILIVGLEKTREYRPTADKAIETIFKELRK